MLYFVDNEGDEGDSDEGDAGNKPLSLKNILEDDDLRFKSTPFWSQIERLFEQRLNSWPARGKITLASVKDWLRPVLDGITDSAGDNLEFEDPKNFYPILVQVFAQVGRGGDVFLRSKFLKSMFKFVKCAFHPDKNQQKNRSFCTGAFKSFNNLKI